MLPHEDSSFSEEKEAKRLLSSRSFTFRGEPETISGGGTKVFWLFSSEKNKTFLTEQRARAYARIVTTGVVLFFLGLIALFVTGALRDPRGLSYSCDFNAFWSAAHFAALGNPAEAYDPAAMKAMEETNAQRVPQGGFIAYPYPPIFQLFCLPLGFLPFLLALQLFLLGGLAAVYRGVTALLPKAWPRSTVLAAPAVLVNLASTQNGFLSAALFAGALHTLDEQPVLAGALLGALAFKPHLALCVPVGLAFARRWRALSAFASSALMLGAVTYIVLGVEAWHAFLASLPMTRAMMQTRPIWGTGQSVYAAMRILGAGDPIGLAAQAVATLFGLACVATACRARPGGRAEVAVMATAALICTPYVMDYDFVCLLPPMAFLAACGCETGWRPHEKAVLALVYFYPLAARTLSLALVPVGPLVVAALLCLLTSRVKQDSSFSEEKEAKRLLFLRRCNGRGELPTKSCDGIRVFWFFLSKKNKTFRWPT